jgi:hypothetical protein
VELVLNSPDWKFDQNELKLEQRAIQLTDMWFENGKKTIIIIISKWQKYTFGPYI